MLCFFTDMAETEHFIHLKKRFLFSTSPLLPDWEHVWRSSPPPPLWPQSKHNNCHLQEEEAQHHASSPMDEPGKSNCCQLIYLQKPQNVTQKCRKKRITLICGIEIRSSGFLSSILINRSLRSSDTSGLRKTELELAQGKSGGNQITEINLQFRKLQ